MTNVTSLPDDLNDERLLTTKQAAKMLGLSEVTLKRMRASNTGPRAIVVLKDAAGRARSVRYSVKEIRQWIEKAPAA